MIKKNSDWSSGFFKVTEALAVVSGVIILLVMIYIAADVTGRYFANRPMPGSYEITMTLLIFIVFLSFAYTHARGGHLRLEFLSKSFPPRGQAVLDILALLIGIVFVSLITWQACEWAWDAWVEKTYFQGIIRLPYYPAKFALALGMFLFSIQLAIDLIRRFGNLLSMSKVTR